MDLFAPNNGGGGTSFQQTLMQSINGVQDRKPNVPLSFGTRPHSASTAGKAY
jgi:hypothetical protein